MAMATKTPAEPLYMVNISVRVPQMTQAEKEALERTIHAALVGYRDATLNVGTAPPRPER